MQVVCQGGRPDARAVMRPEPSGPPRRLWLHATTAHPVAGHRRPAVPARSAGAWGVPSSEQEGLIMPSSLCIDLVCGRQIDGSDARGTATLAREGGPR